jgi:multiple sugar transport system permease protein
MAQTLASDRAALPLDVSGSRGRRKRRLGVFRQGLSFWLFLLPAVAFFVGYQVYPIFRVLWISFTDFQYLSDEPANWVGFDNYIAAFNDPLMWRSLWRAALFTMMFLPGTIILPLLLAILVDRVTNPRLATFDRVILLIPAVIPSTLIFVLWKWMYNYQVAR